MKKLILGLSLFICGFWGSLALIFSTVLSPLNPWSYNGIEGWLGVILGMQLLLPLILCLGIGIVGLIISIKEAFYYKPL